LLGKLLHKLESGYYLSCSSPMSESSPDKTSGPNSSPTSMITSQGGSDSEGDILKNALAGSARELTKAQKQSNYAFSEDLLAELQTSRRQSKMKWYPDSKTETNLSPFAKVFVPRVQRLASSIDSSVVVDDTKRRNRSMTTTHEPLNLNYGGTRIHELNE